MSNNYSSNSGNKEENFENNSPFIISDLLKLNESEQKLLKWIMKQGDVTFAEAKNYINEEDEIVSDMLNNLCNLGFLEEFNVETEQRFRRCLPHRKNSGLSDRIWGNLDF